MTLPRRNDDGGNGAPIHNILSAYSKLRQAENEAAEKRTARNATSHNHAKVLQDARHDGPLLPFRHATDSAREVA